MCTDGSGCSRKTEHFAEAWYVLNINNTWKNSSQKQTYRVKKSYRITAVKPPFLTFSATVPGWDCSHFSQSIKHKHTQTQRHELKWRATCVAHAVPSPCSLWQKGLFQVGRPCMPASKHWVQRGHLVLLTPCQTAPNEGAQLLQCHAIVSTKPAARPTCWNEHTRSCTCSNNSQFSYRCITAARDDWWVELNSMPAKLKVNGPWVVFAGLDWVTGSLRICI